MNVKDSYLNDQMKKALYIKCKGLPVLCSSALTDCLATLPTSIIGFDQSKLVLRYNYQHVKSSKNQWFTPHKTNTVGSQHPPQPLLTPFKPQLSTHCLETALKPLNPHQKQPVPLTDTDCN